MQNSETAREKELLCGLLTRDPNKRWKYEQVARWLSGECGITQHFDATSVAKAQLTGTLLKPIKFMDKHKGSMFVLIARIGTCRAEIHRKQSVDGI